MKASYPTSGLANCPSHFITEDKYSSTEKALEKSSHVYEVANRHESAFTLSVAAADAEAEGEAEARAQQDEKRTPTVPALIMMTS